MQWGVWLRVAGAALLIAIPITIILAPQLAGSIYSIIVALAPLWLPVTLAFAAWPLWLTFIRSYHVSRVDYDTLELKPGPNTSKSARPMELVWYALYYRSEVSFRTALLKGQVRMPWAFEVQATGGSVRLFMHVPTSHRAAIEARLRQEYRDIDIDEARDYSRERPFSPFESRLLMREFVLGKPDPYPIRTFEADEHAKERHDSFAELLEELALVPEGQEVWISLMIRPHQRDWGRGWWDWLKTPTDTLHDDARAEIQKLVGGSGDMRALPAHVADSVHAIERALNKPSYDCGLRVAYVARRDQWDEKRAASIEHMFDRFGDHHLNHFEPYDPAGLVGWPLSDVFAAAPVLAMEYFLKVYRRRAFFSPPYYGTSFTLNTEELATLWHLPKFGRTSALGGARSAALEPPENLPV